MSDSKSISEKRLAANRENAKLSTGPRTPEGKAASSRNAVKHGFRASSFCAVRLEDLDEIANLKADAIACYKPVNAQELVAIERIAIAQQQIFRGARLDAGMFTSAMNEVVDRHNNPVTPMDPDMVGDGDIEITRQQNRNYCTAEGFRRISKESNSIGLMLRYRAQAEREYRRAVEDFDRLKALRAQPATRAGVVRVQTKSHDMPNEPNVGTEPGEPDDIMPIRELNWIMQRYPEKQPNEPTAPVPNEPTSAPPANSPAPAGDLATNRTLEDSAQSPIFLAWMSLICFLRLCFARTNHSTAKPSASPRLVSDSGLSSAGRHARQTNWLLDWVRRRAESSSLFARTSKRLAQPA